jgi:hypothetical protein
MSEAPALDGPRRPAAKGPATALVKVTCMMIVNT